MTKKLYHIVVACALMSVSCALRGIEGSLQALQQSLDQLKDVVKPALRTATKELTNEQKASFNAQVGRYWSNEKPSDPTLKEREALRDKVLSEINITNSELKVDEASILNAIYIVMLSKLNLHDSDMQNKLYKLALQSSRGNFYDDSKKDYVQEQVDAAFPEYGGVDGTKWITHWVRTMDSPSIRTIGQEVKKVLGLAKNIHQLIAAVDKWDMKNITNKEEFSQALKGLPWDVITLEEFDKASQEKPPFESYHERIQSLMISLVETVNSKHGDMLQKELEKKRAGGAGSSGAKKKLTEEEVQMHAHTFIMASMQGTFHTDLLQGPVKELYTYGVQRLLDLFQSKYAQAKPTYEEHVFVGSDAATLPNTNIEKYLVSLINSKDEKDAIFYASIVCGILLYQRFISQSPYTYSVSWKSIMPYNKDKTLEKLLPNYESKWKDFMQGFMKKAEDDLGWTWK